MLYGEWRYKINYNQLPRYPNIRVGLRLTFSQKKKNRQQNIVLIFKYNELNYLFVIEGIISTIDYMNIYHHFMIIFIL